MHTSGSGARTLDLFVIFKMSLFFFPIVVCKETSSVASRQMFEGDRIARRSLNVQGGVSTKVATAQVLSHRPEKKQRKVGSQSSSFSEPICKGRCQE